MVITKYSEEGVETKLFGMSAVTLTKEGFGDFCLLEVNNFFDLDSRLISLIAFNCSRDYGVLRWSDSAERFRFIWIFIIFDDDDDDDALSDECGLFRLLSAVEPPALAPAPVGTLIALARYSDSLVAGIDGTVILEAVGEDDYLFF